MIDQIICTQDVPGERVWLESQFPGYKNLQTEFSGLWPNNKLSFGDTNYLWEIPPDSDIKLDKIQQEKILSLYEFNKQFVDSRWCQTEKLVTNLDFAPGTKSNLAQIITFTRCGTVFLEKLLYKHLNYTELSPHVSLGAKDTDYYIFELCNTNRPDVFLTYRNDWWEWATSIFIAEQVEWFDNTGTRFWPHSGDSLDWTNAKPFSVSADRLCKLHDYAFSMWNSFCHLRSKFTDLNFYVIEFSELIQIKKENLDRKLPYKKENFIENYFEIKELFDQQYLPMLQKYQTNSLRHLQSMNCHMSIDSLVTAN